MKDNVNKKNSNKKSKINLSSISQSIYNPVSSYEYKTSNGYYRWGSDNKYPYYLYDLYLECATLQSIINGSVDFTMGNGIINNTNMFIEENQAGDTLVDIIFKIILDRWIFGGFALQVSYDSFHNISEISYIDFRKLRIDEKLKKVWYCNEHISLSQSSNSYQEYDFFDPSNTESYVQIYYYKGNKTRSIYPIPDWNAAITSAETQLEIQKFHYNTIKNNFMVNGILHIAGDEPSSDEKNLVEQMINDKFSGTDNAARLMLVWGNGVDVEFTRLQDDNFDDKYNTLSDDTRQNLFISLSANPILFGMPVSSGFTDVDYESAFNLYNRTRIIPIQNEIVRVFDKITSQENSIQFKPFNINWE